jgi:hypothetical protein
MKMTIDMPAVSSCEVIECAYNVESACHARAITVGDGVHPGCDTFFSNATHTREARHIAGVGACKVASCMHNSDFECMADSIAIGREKSGVGCLTYRLG